MTAGSPLLSRITEFSTSLAPPDLMTASPEALQGFGIPPRPDLATDGALYDVWYAFFGKGTEFVRAEIEVKDDEFQPETRQERVAPAFLGRSRFETSRNWCGAFIEPSRGTIFAQVSGRWVVPNPAVPHGAPPGVYACSTWVGFDGQRRYLDSSLPQVGTWQAATLSDAGTTTTETYAWFQWWARNLPGTEPGVIRGVPVAVDDTVLCMVRAWGPNAVAVYVKNVSIGRLAHFVVQAPRLDLGSGQFHTYSISGATAEWIMERPTPLDDPNALYSLADYGHTDLLDCHASEADPTLPGWPWLVGRDRDLCGERLIRMCDTQTNPMRVALISMAERLDGTSVRATYGGFR